MSFQSDIAKFAKKAKTNAMTVRRSVFFQLAENIVKLTPVDKGRARGNWQPSLRMFKSGEISGVGVDPMPKVASVANSAKGDEPMFLVNNVPYIHKLEYGGYNEGPKTVGGFSKQAPRGMVRVTVREFKKALRKAVQGLK